MAEPQMSSRGAKGSGRGFAIALLVAGLVVGLGIGYLVAPRPQAPPQAEGIQTTGSVVHISVLAAPPTNMLSFSIGGLENPTISVARGANVTIHFANIDEDMMPHSFVVVGGAPPFPADPGEPALPGAETPMAHEGQMPGENVTASFPAATAGTYYYVCHISGHAAGRMYGTFVVRA